MDVSATIAHFAMLVTVRRPGATTYVDGFATEAVAATRTVPMMIRPVRAADAAQLPQGISAGESIVGWSTAAVYGPTATQAADIVEHDGQDYEVVFVERHAPQGNFWKFYATRRGQHAA